MGSFRKAWKARGIRTSGWKGGKVMESATLLSLTGLEDDVWQFKGYRSNPETRGDGSFTKRIIGEYATDMAGWRLNHPRVEGSTTW